jgi:pSer/pThr/pTyr-binding forkhead associated (FHA) protein
MPDHENGDGASGSRALIPGNYGRLVLLLPGNHRHEFTLSKARIRIGRASTNDVVVQDSRVSRNHALLECDAAGCTVVDAGSPNGTWINGVRVERRLLKSGDVLEMGGATARFEAVAPEAVEQITRLNSVADNSVADNPVAHMDSALSHASLQMEVAETNTARLAVRVAGRTWEVALDQETLTIGRLPDNDLVIDRDSVSRHHARVERRGDGFVIQDLNTGNGTWIGGVRIDRQVLADGDAIRIGSAQLVYKAVFSCDDLTVTDEAIKPSRRPVVVIPGMGGSKLWRGSELIWPNVRHLLAHVDELSLANPLEARGVLDEVVIIPNFLKLQQYSLLTDYLVEELGYEEGRDLLEFSYDFRQDVRESARKLAAVLDGWNIAEPITIIAHSLGCLLSRYYVECLGGRRKVGRLVLMGGPHSGAPHTFAAMVHGVHLFPLGVLDHWLRGVLATWPSTYHLLPTYPCVATSNGTALDILGNASWLPEPRRNLLAMTREFRTELGTRSSVPTVCIFGYGLKTTTKIHFECDASGLCRSISSVCEPAGDGSIPESSACMGGTEIHPVRQHHGVMFVDSDVKKRLKLELMRDVAVNA